MKRELKASNVPRCVKSDITVAVHVPMKRELKGRGRRPRLHIDESCCSPCPYEEGTESKTKVAIRQKKGGRCSPCPYEEGTESPGSETGYIKIGGVAVHVPMKRELKVENTNVIGV